MISNNYFYVNQSPSLCALLCLTMLQSSLNGFFSFAAVRDQIKKNLVLQSAARFPKSLYLLILDSISSQTIAGIVAAIFCAVLFTGVAMTRCFMTGACGNRNMQYADERTRERQFNVGIDEGNTFQADFPPSYSTGNVNMIIWLFQSVIVI